MKYKVLYVFILSSLSIAWFSDANFGTKQMITPKMAQFILPMVTELSSLGMTIEGKSVPGRCNIETINERNFDNTIQAIDKASILRITGWALDIDQSRLPLSLAVRLTAANNNDYFAHAQIGSPRPDVLSHFSLEKKLLDSGFQSQSSLQTIPVGEYRVTLVMNFKDSVYTCDNSRVISIQ